MSFMPDEIETMKEIAANLEKCATIMGQQIVTKNGRSVLKEDALNNIARALILYITVSDIPVKQFKDIMRRLFWDKQEKAKRIEDSYFDVVNFSPIEWEKFDEDEKLTGIIRLEGETKGLVKDFQVCAEMAQRDATPEQPAETRQNTKTTIVAIIVSLILSCIFLLSVWYVPFTIFTCFKNHPNSYGLQCSIVFLITCLAVGFFKPQWRKWCWGTASLAFVVLILSLLGGKSR